MVVAELSIYPLGKGESVGHYVARCLPIIESSGLDHQTHAMGTILEGEYDQVMGVVKQCFDALAADCDRIECILRLDYRRGRRSRIRGKVASLEQKVGHAVKTAP
jgi:uncharacterized protein (TIGR00106 family)